WIRQQVQQIDPRLTVHDFCIIPGGRESGEKTSLVFDCVAPRDFPVEDADLRQSITRLVQQRYPRCQCQITIDRDYAALPHAEGEPGQ
ncbi:MAG: hypothetical protein PHO10_09530, partial [Gemmiger sp.]|nr:hypothetical protein [Gemmiger sp.]